MQPTGGAFLIGIGSGIAVGAGSVAMTGALQAFLAPTLAGAAAGAAFLIAARIWGSGRFGRPSRSQGWAMTTAIALEIAAFWGLAAAGWFNVWDVRTGMSVALGIVAVHFLVMRVSHGPPMLWLGLAALAWIASADMLRLTLPVLILGDGLLKIGFGAAMARPMFAGLTASTAGGGHTGPQGVDRAGMTGDRSLR
jgi:hypothetical protein